MGPGFKVLKTYTELALAVSDISALSFGIVICSTLSRMRTRRVHVRAVGENESEHRHQAPAYN